MTGAPSWQLQQLYALWQQRQARLARWAAGTLAFATLVPILVLGPYERTTRASAELLVRRDAADERSRRSGEEAAELAEVQERLAEISAALDRFSWEARRDTLRDRMRELGDAWSVLERAEAAAIRSAEELRADRMRIQSPLANPVQAPPPNPAPGASAPNLRNPRVPASNEPAPASRPAPEGAPPGSASPDDLFTIAEAIERLGLDGDELAMASAERKHSLLEEHVAAQADAAAKASIRGAGADMQVAVVGPLKELLAAHPDAASRVPAFAEAVGSVEVRLGQWRERFLADTEWYRTVSGKGETMHSLRRAMDRGPGDLPGQPESWTAAVQKAVRDQEERTREEIERLRADSVEAQARLAQFQEQLGLLGTKLKAILPSWIGEIVSPPELMNLFAPVMIALMAILGACAWRIRQSYLALRALSESEGVPIGGIAEGSTWTLARRDATATLATGAVYIGGLIALWIFFAYGTGLAASYAGLREASGLVTADSIVDTLVGPPALPSLRAAGHAVFAAFLVAIVATLGARRA